jgi:hypothetical protein
MSLQRPDLRLGGDHAEDQTAKHHPHGLDRIDGRWIVQIDACHASILAGASDIEDATAPGRKRP